MTDPGLLQGILVFLLLMLPALVIINAAERDTRERTFQTRIFFAGYCLRFLLSILIYQFGLVNVFGDEDAQGWLGGKYVLDRWQARGVSFLDLPFAMSEAYQGHHRGYHYFLGFCFYVTASPVRLVAAAINGFCGAMTAVFAYLIARTLFSEWVARRVAWWSCLFPSMLIWSALTVKEPVVIFLETLALYGCVRLRKETISVPHLALCAFTILALIPFRFYAAYVVGLAVLTALVLPELLRPTRAISGLMLVLIVTPMVLATGRLARGESQLESFNLDRVQNFRRDIATGGERFGGRSGVLTDYDIRTPEGFAIGTLVGAAHLLAAPFPWQWKGGSTRMLLSIPELLYWWFLLWRGLIPGVVYLIRQRARDVMVIFFFITGFGLLYSLMFGNIGLVFRQRAQLLPWLFIIVAVGLERKYLQWQEERRAAEARREALVASPPRWQLDRAGSGT